MVRPLEPNGGSPMLGISSPRYWLAGMSATVIACGCGRTAVPGAAPSSLRDCIARPRMGYVSPALRRRTLRCRALVGMGEPDPASGVWLGADVAGGRSGNSGGRE